MFFHGGIFCSTGASFVPRRRHRNLPGRCGFIGLLRVPFGFPSDSLWAPSGSLRVPSGFPPTIPDPSLPGIIEERKTNETPPYNGVFG